MNSCLYEGTIRHRRFRPIVNSFRYRLFFMYLDLDEMDIVSKVHPLWSIQRRNFASFYREDHLGDPNTALKKAVCEEVKRQIGKEPNGPIRLMTHFRYFGYVFNPVSFYFCYNASDTDVETIIAEVHNTPWGEEHVYVMGQGTNEHPFKGWRRHRFGKAFHVSPFMDMHLDYDWRFRLPGSEMNAHVLLTEKGNHLFDASLSLKRRKLSKQAFNRALFLYPFMTGKVIAMIHWQALRLYLKGAPFFVHPKKRVTASEKENSS